MTEEVRNGLIIIVRYVLVTTTISLLGFFKWLFISLIYHYKKFKIFYSKFLINSDILIRRFKKKVYLYYCIKYIPFENSTLEYLEKKFFRYLKFFYITRVEGIFLEVCLLYYSFADKYPFLNIFLNIYLKFPYLITIYIVYKICSSKKHFLIKIICLFLIF